MIKKRLTYLLFFLISTAYCIESASYIFKALQSDTINYCVEDMDCDHEDGDSDSSYEKEVKVLYPCNHIHHSYMNLKKADLQNFARPLNINFSTANYSRVVYSPPELG